MRKTIKRHRYKDNEIIETRTLIFEPYSYSDINLVMSLLKLKLTPDLLSHKKLMYSQDKLTNKYYGHCYHSSQALYFMMDTDKLTPMSAIDWRDEKHWWLQDGNTIYDVTEDQYYSRSKVPPHSKGKKSVWYGWKQRPQQITLDLMVRVLGDRLESDITM